MALPFQAGFNTITIGFLAIFLVFLYLLGLILKNTITVMTPKEFGKFAMFIGLIAWMLPWIIMGNIVQVVISFVLVVVLFIILTASKFLKKGSKNANAAASGKGGQQ